MSKPKLIATAIGIVYLLLLSILFTSSAAAQPAEQNWEDISTSTSLEQIGNRYDRRTRSYTSTASVTNTFGDVLDGPIRLVVMPGVAGRTVVDPEGTTANGEAFFTLVGEGSNLEDGASQDQALQFTGGRGQLAYTTRVEQLPSGPVDSDGDGIPDSEDLCPEDSTNTCLTVIGQVFGNGATIAGASIKLGLNTVNETSDADGSFLARVGSPEEVSSNGAGSFIPVEVTAPGFATGNAKVQLEPGVESYNIVVNLQQVSKTITEDDDVISGVEINQGGEPVGSLTIPSNALPDGVTQVTGSITYLDPETDDILSAPGGDLLALPVGADPNDPPVILETFGMMEFDLRDQDGNEINELNDDAQVCMKATAGLQAGDTVPLWHYDESQGLWIEEGEGTVVNLDGQLQICGAVSHFTWWNYDRPIETHSCFFFNIIDEAPGESLSDLNWRAEGISYNGTSPDRACTNGSDDFDSLTVKISTLETTEQIRVFAFINSTKYYLASDGDGTFSLTADVAQAEVFDTPMDNGSCLTGTLNIGGQCQPLDYKEGVSADGILPVSSDINLPPVISEMTLTAYIISINETLDATATVTDPEGEQVSVNWSLDCNYYGLGDSPGDESVSPITDSGESGSTFTTQATAPSSLNSTFEQCLVTLNAEDPYGNTASATRWFTVAGSADYIFSGIVYGIDGQPMASGTVDYFNWCDGAGISESSPIDIDGSYYIEVDLRSCVDNYDGYAYLDTGTLGVGFGADDGNWWWHSTSIDAYGGEVFIGDLQASEIGSGGCGVNDEGQTFCNQDIRLPNLWAPLSGTAYKSLPNDVIWEYSSRPSFFGEFGGFSSTDLWGLAGPVSAPSTSVTYGSTLVPLGMGWITPYEEQQSNSWTWIEEGQLATEVPSLDGAVQDVADSRAVTAPVTVKVFDTLGGPLQFVGVEVYNWWFWNPDAPAGTTDNSGEVTLVLPLGAQSAETGAPDYLYTNFIVRTKDQPVFVDLNSQDQCLYQGQVFDPAGTALAVADLSFWAYTNQGDLDFSGSTEADGGFEFSHYAVDWLDIEADQESNYYWTSKEMFVNNCRPEGGSQKVYRVDLQFPPQTLNFFPPQTLDFLEVAF